MTMPPQSRPPLGDGSLYYGDDTPTPPARPGGTTGGKTGVAPVAKTKTPTIGTVPTPQPPIMPTRQPPVGVLRPPVRPVMPFGGDIGGTLANWDVSPLTKALAMRHLSGGGFGGGGGGNTGGGF